MFPRVFLTKAFPNSSKPHSPGLEERSETLERELSEARRRAGARRSGDGEGVGEQLTAGGNSIF